MKFKFYGFQENILAKALDRAEDAVYVFDNYQNMLKAREYYRRPFPERGSLFLSMGDLKEKLFPTGKLVLREEKLAALFYQLLTAEEKKELGVENYFDSIELSAEFFGFYREMHEYKVKELKGLENWQQEKYELFQSIRERYCRKLEELGCIDSTLAFDFKYFDDFFLKDYREIVFVNIISFTPMEIELLKKLESCSYRLEFVLQLNENDYDRENIRIRSFTFPEELSTEIELYHTEADFLQLLGLLDRVHGKEGLERKVCILDADFASSTYQDLLSPEKIRVEKDISFTETGLYRFLEALYNLMLNAQWSNGELKLEIKILLDNCYQNEFRDFYNLGIEELKALYELARDDYVYLSRAFIESSGEKLAGFKPVFDDLQKINKSGSLRELIEFLQDIQLRKLDDYRYSNNISRYFEALQELNSLEEMGIIESWDKFFPDRAQGLFRLVLNYLRYKVVKTVSEEGEGRPPLIIKDLLSAPHLQAESLFILNATHGIIPAESNGFLLTERQRGDSGLKTAEMRRLEEKYYFFRHIFSSRRAVIFNLDNIEENISSSSFVEELILAYGLENKELEIGTKHYPLITGSIFGRGKGSLAAMLQAETREDDNLYLEKEDFKEEFSLAFYKYLTLKTCYYRFFLEHIAGLEEEKPEIKNELDPRFLGILTHEFFEDILKESGPELEIDTRKLKGIIKKKLDSCSLKINRYYMRYYEDILFPKIEESILNFILTFRRRIKGEIESIETEWKPDSVREKYFYVNQFSSIYLNGRIDLLIKTEEGLYLIDFKTGAGDLKQLDFYSLLLNPELSGECNIEKYIYSVLDEKYIAGKKGTETALAEEIKNTLTGFFETGEYIYEYKASICDRCKMLDICRVVRK